MAVEEPGFQIVKADGDFELRDYPGLVVAEVTVGGDRRDASNDGFLSPVSTYGADLRL